MNTTEVEKVCEHMSNAHWKIHDQLEVFSKMQYYILLLEDYLKNLWENIQNMIIFFKLQ